MAIKWTEKMAIEALRTLTNPFVIQTVQQPEQKLRLPNAQQILAAPNNNGVNGTVNA